MQTFIPYTDNFQSVAVLDKKRLQKQNVECLQIWNALQALKDTEAKRTAWMTHPAVRMWLGYEDAFLAYWWAVEHECRSRGIKTDKINNQRPKCPEEWEDPWWWGSLVHDSHKRNLLWKDPKYYQEAFGVCENSFIPELQPPYIWPIHREEYVEDGKKVVVNRWAKSRRFPSPPPSGLILTVQPNGRTVTYFLEGWEE